MKKAQLSLTMEALAAANDASARAEAARKCGGNPLAEASLAAAIASLDAARDRLERALDDMALGRM